MAEPKMKDISLGKGGGGIWAIGAADGTVYRLFGDAGVVGWLPDKDGKADTVAAVDWAGCWCINKSHEIWQLVDSYNIDKGGQWNRIPTHSGTANAATISVGADGSVWYAATDGTLFVRENNGWKQDPVGKAVVVDAVSSTEVWCVNAAHEIWHLQAGTWSKLAGHQGKSDAKTISRGTDGSLWYISTDGNLFFYANDGDMWFPDTNWNQSQMGTADVISVSTHGNVWCINNKGEVWQSNDRQWSLVTEQGPEGKSWNYTVKSGENLLAIVRKEFSLKEPQDTERINWLVNLIVAQNKLNIPHLTKDLIKSGDQFIIRY